MPRDHKENFTIKVKTLSGGKNEILKSITTNGKLGAFRITVNPLERDERSKISLHVTGWARSNGILELRVGQYDEESGLEVGPQTVFETVQYIDTEQWTDVDLDPKKGRQRKKK